MAKINPPWYHLGVSKLPQGVELRNFVLWGMPRQQQEHCVWEELKVSGGRQQCMGGVEGVWGATAVFARDQCAATSGQLPGGIV